MKKIVLTKYELNENEFALIAKCVDYCVHRYSEHPDSGITKVMSMEQIVTLKRDIEILKSKESSIPTSKILEEWKF